MGLTGTGKTPILPRQKVLSQSITSWSQRRTVWCPVSEQFCLQSPYLFVAERKMSKISSRDRTFTLRLICSEIARLNEASFKFAGFAVGSQQVGALFRSVFRCCAWKNPCYYSLKPAGTMLPRFYHFQSFNQVNEDQGNRINGERGQWNVRSQGHSI